MAHKVTGHELYRWPEFRALCARLGINTTLPTSRLTITVVGDELVQVTQEYPHEKVAELTRQSADYSRACQEQPPPAYGTRID